MVDEETPEDGAEFPPSATDDKAFQEATRRKKIRTEKGDEFWRGVMANEFGRQEIWAFLGSLHTFEERFECGPNGFPQAEATWYRAGERDVGIRLHQSLMRIDPANTIKMHEEHDTTFQKPKRQTETRENLIGRRTTPS